MISCEEFLSQISELIDQEIDGGQDAEWREAMQAHARQCRNCFIVFETTKQMIRMVGDPSIFELPSEVSHRLHDAIEDRLQRDGARSYTLAEHDGPARIIDLPWTAQPVRQSRWSSSRLAIAAAILLLAVVAGSHWLGSVQTVSVAGWLTDAHCYATYRKHPEIHPRACMLAARCQQSGFGVINASGVFLPFDSGTTDKVVTMLEATPSPDHIWVEASGRERNGVLDVRTLAIRTPDQRLARGPALTSPGFRAAAIGIAQAGWF